MKTNRMIITRCWLMPALFVFSVLLTLVACTTSAQGILKVAVSALPLPINRPRPHRFADVVEVGFGIQSVWFLSTSDSFCANVNTGIKRFRKRLLISYSSLIMNPNMLKRKMSDDDTIKRGLTPF